MATEAEHVVSEKQKTDFWLNVADRFCVFHEVLKCAADPRDVVGHYQINISRTTVIQKSLITYHPGAILRGYTEVLVNLVE